MGRTSDSANQLRPCRGQAECPRTSVTKHRPPVLGAGGPTVKTQTWETAHQEDSQLHLDAVGIHTDAT